MLLKLFILLTILFLTQAVLAESTKTIDLLNQKARGFSDHKNIAHLILKNPKQESDASLWRLARAFFSLGKYAVDKNKKKNYFSLCQKNADRALTFNDKLAEGYYFKALCMGKLGQLKGLLSSLFMVFSFKENMEQAAKLDPSVEQGGAHRALGKLYIELPALFGRDLKKSIDHLKQAIHYGPIFADNYIFLAKSYYANGNLAAARFAIQGFLENVQDFPVGPDFEKKYFQARELLKKF